MHLINHLQIIVITHTKSLFVQNKATKEISITQLK